MIHAHCPVYQARARSFSDDFCTLTRCSVQITAEGPYACLCTFLETLFTMIWRVALRDIS